MSICPCVFLTSSVLFLSHLICPMYTPHHLFISVSLHRFCFFLTTFVLFLPNFICPLFISPPLFHVSLSCVYFTSSVLFLPHLICSFLSHFICPLSTSPYLYCFYLTSPILFLPHIINPMSTSPHLSCFYLALSASPLLSCVYLTLSVHLYFIIWPVALTASMLSIYLTSSFAPFLQYFIICFFASHPIICQQFNLYLIICSVSISSHQHYLFSFNLIS